MKKKVVTFFISSIFILGSCQNEKYENRIDLEGQQENLEINNVVDKDQISQDVKQQLKIIKNAKMKFLVNNIDSVANQVIIMTKNTGGYLSSMDFNQNEYQKETNLTLSIPFEHFEIILNQLPFMAKHVDYNKVSSQDVTEEYIDLKSRLKIKEQVKKRYEDILYKNAKRVEDIIKVEEQLQEIQEEIESAKGRMNYLNTRASLSTIELILYEKVDFEVQPKSYHKTFIDKMVEGFKTGWTFLENVIVSLTYIWPFLILSLIGFIVYKKIKNKH